jgi:hypothetical protein
MPKMSIIISQLTKCIYHTYHLIQPPQQSLWMIFIEAEPQAQSAKGFVQG